MNSLYKPISTFILLALLIACSDKDKKINNSFSEDSILTVKIPNYRNYLNDSNISDKDGNPAYFKRHGFKNCEFFFVLDESKRIFTKLPSFYLPFTIKNDTGIVDTGLDSCMAEGFTKEMMKLMNEPLLYNYYLGKDIIRMYFVAALRLLVQTDIIKEDNKVIMQRKTNNADGTIARLPDKELPLAVWDTLHTMMNNAGYWNLKPRQVNNNSYEDGYRVIIEAHMKEAYWYVIWDNEGVLDKLMEYIRINLAELRQSIWVK